jgi:hypothetical protein
MGIFPMLGALPFSEYIVLHDIDLLCCEVSITRSLYWLECGTDGRGVVVRFRAEATDGYWLPFPVVKRPVRGVNHPSSYLAPRLKKV